MRRIKQCLGVLAAVTLAASVTAGPASATTQQGVGTRAQWQTAIAQVPERGAGCYRASYPALQWHAVKCVAAPKMPVAPALSAGSAMRAVPEKVGDGDDYSAQVPGLISKATGTFKKVTSTITEKGKVNNAGSEVANAYSLQLNTQFISGSPACSGASDPAKCQAWQQFVYTYQDKSTSFIFMQYWLINYNATCPSGWNSFSADCYTNSPSSTVATLTAKDLATLKLAGSALVGGQDGVSLSVGSGKATLVNNSDSVIDLAKFWNTTEWGVFGDGGGGEAFFGTNSTLEAQTALNTTSTSSPACVKEGFTAETNNLKLASTPALGSETLPTMASRQTNGTSGTASCAVAA